MDGRYVFCSDLGWMGVEASGLGLRRLVFDQPSEPAVWRVLGPSWRNGDEEAFSLEDLAARLRRYAAGQAVSWAGIPIDWSGLTPFQVRVLKACRRIPRGRTRTYAELAKEVGSPRAARAVGSVMARNRLPLIIPCHRVVGCRGALGGFSSRSGLAMKRRLLQSEAKPAQHRPDCATASIGRRTTEAIPSLP